MQKPTADQVQSGGNTNPGKVAELLSKLPKPRLLSVVVLILIILLLAFTAGFLVKYIPKYMHQRELNAIEELQDQTEKLEFEDKYPESQQLWQEYIEKQRDSRFREKAMRNLGHSYFNNQQYKEALEWYYKARDEKGEDWLPTTTAIASAAEMLGDKELTIKYNQLAIEETEALKKTFAPDHPYQFDLDNNIIVYQKIIERQNAQ